MVQPRTVCDLLHWFLPGKLSLPCWVLDSTQFENRLIIETHVTNITYLRLGWVSTTHSFMWNVYCCGYIYWRGRVLFLQLLQIVYKPWTQMQHSNPQNYQASPGIIIDSTGLTLLEVMAWYLFWKLKITTLSEAKHQLITFNDQYHEISQLPHSLLYWMCLHSRTPSSRCFDGTKYSFMSSFVTADYIAAGIKHFYSSVFCVDVL